MALDWGRGFLSHAKKVSVVNICKQFNKMISDDLVKVSIKSNRLGALNSGIFTLINARISGR